MVPRRIFVFWNAEQAFQEIFFTHFMESTTKINLCLEDDLCRLRIRDNGVNFNPLEYQYDSEDFDIHGIELVKKVSKSMDYIRAIDMNNTIISF